MYILFHSKSQSRRCITISMIGLLLLIPGTTSALTFSDTLTTLNTTASTLRTQLLTAPTTALFTASEHLARANDALTATILTAAATIDTNATALRTTLTTPPQLAFSWGGMTERVRCFFVTCTTAVTPAPPVPTRTVTTPQPTPATPVSTPIPQPTTPNPPAPPLTLTTTQPEIVTKVIQNTVLSGTDATLDAKLATLRASLLDEIARVRQTTSNNYQAISISNRIDSLTDTTLVSPTIRNATLTGSSLGATTGSFSGTLTVTGTSTFSGDSIFDTDTLVVDSLNNRVGIGTTSPSDTLAINGALYLANTTPSVTDNRLYASSGSLYYAGSLIGGATTGNWDLASGNVYRTTGNVGIGTTSPYAKLSVVGEAVASHFTATSTTATSTFKGGFVVGTGASPSGLVYDRSTGYVGVGTSTPAVKLHVQGDGVFTGYVNATAYIDPDANYYSAFNATAGVSANNWGLDINGTSGYDVHGVRINTVDTGTNKIGNIRFSRNGTPRWTIKKDDTAETGSNAGSWLTFQAQSDAGGTVGNALALKRDLSAYFGGNLGIGTTSPYAKLSVVGEAVASHFTATSTTATSTFSGALALPSTATNGAGVLLVNGNRFLHNRSNGETSVFLGKNAGTLNPSGLGLTVGDNTGIGKGVMGSLTSGYVNTGVGSGALGLLTTGFSNTALGVSALAAMTTGSYNTAIGSEALFAATAGANSNTAVGYQALGAVITGDQNVGVGPYAGVTITTGSNNVLIGSSADVSSGGLSNAVAIGVNAIVGASNSIVLGGTGADAVNVGIGTTSPYAKLSVVGEAVASHFTATSTTATSTFSGGLTTGASGLSVLTSGRVGIGTTPASVGKFKVGGAGFFTSESNAFGSGSTYTSLLLGDASPSSGGALFAFYDSSVTSRPFVGLSGFSTGSQRGLYFGGGGWEASDANSLYFYTDPTYSSGTDNDGGQLRMVILPGGSVAVGGSTLFNTHTLEITSSGASDSAIGFSNTVTNYFTTGFDTSDPAFKISKGDTLGTNDLLSIPYSSGNIGIGTTSPYARLSVVGEAVAEKFTATSTTAISTFMGSLGIGTTSAATNNALVVQGGVCITAGTTCPTVAAGGLRVDTAGSVADDPGDVFDLAERYPASEVMEPGDIAMIDVDASPATVKRGTSGGTALGIVSTRAAIAINGSDLTLGPGYEATSTSPLIALAGRVPVKVSLEGGSIKKGDRITLSGTPGVGQKATSSTYTVGIALDNFNESSEKDANGVGKVLVFVNLSYTRIDPAVADGSLLATTGSTTGSPFWNFDDATGRLNFVTPLNLNNFDIVGVRAIRSATNQWSIDEAGKLVVGEVEAQRVTTKTLCLDDICIEKDTLRVLMERNGLFGTPATSDGGSAAEEGTSTSEDTSTQAQEGGSQEISIPDPTPEVGTETEPTATPEPESTSDATITAPPESSTTDDQPADE